MIQNSSAPRRSISENLLRLGTMMVRERARQREKQKRRNRDGQPDHPSDNARGTKRKTENEGEHEVAEGQDSMAVSCLRVEELTRRDIHEEATTRGRYDVGSVEEEDNKNVNMAMDVPIEEDYEQKLAEASDYIDGQELEPEVVKKARALKMEWYWKMNVYEKRPEEECFEETKRPPIKVKRVDRNKKRQTTHEREVEAGDETDQYKQGTRVLRSNSTTRGDPDATVSNGCWKQAQGVHDQRRKPRLHARPNIQ